MSVLATSFLPLQVLEVLRHKAQLSQRVVAALSAMPESGYSRLLSSMGGGGTHIGGTSDVKLQIAITVIADALKSGELPCYRSEAIEVFKSLQLRAIPFHAHPELLTKKRRYSNESSMVEVLAIAELLSVSLRST